MVDLPNKQIFYEISVDEPDFQKIENIIENINVNWEKLHILATEIILKIISS